MDKCNGNGRLEDIYSHLILDSVVHDDVSGNLFYPLQIECGLNGVLSWGDVNILCIILGLLGSAILWKRGVILDWLETQGFRK